MVRWLENTQCNRMPHYQKLVKAIWSVVNSFLSGYSAEYWSESRALFVESLHWAPSASLSQGLVLAAWPLESLQLRDCVIPENIHTSPPPLWKFQLSFIHFFKFFGLIEPPILQEIPIPSVGGVWIFSGTAHCWPRTGSEPLGLAVEGVCGVLEIICLVECLTTFQSLPQFWTFFSNSLFS